MSQPSDTFNQANQPQADDQLADQQSYGQREEYAQSGTLDEGYGQSQQMAEDQWSADRYQAQSAQVDSATLDQGEPHVGQKASDIDQMVGGMIGSEAANPTQEQPE